MKLKKTIIKGFRSIKETEAFLVDEKVTILIGANDHGKSNIISAIEYLNDERTFQKEDINWDLSDTDEISIEWHFDASDDVLRALSKLSPAPVISPAGTPTAAGASQVRSLGILKGSR